jgi:hypothetical protein
MEIKSASASCALGFTIGSAIRASCGDTMGACAQLISTALLINHIVGSRRNDLAQCIAIHTVRNTSATAQVKGARASRALCGTISRTVSSSCGRSPISARALLVRTALFVGHIICGCGNNLALSIAINCMWNTSIPTQVKFTRAGNAFFCTIHWTVGSHRCISHILEKICISCDDWLPVHCVTIYIA